MNALTPRLVPRLPLAQARQVDKVCDRFEAAWKTAGSSAEHPCLDDYLTETPELDRAAVLRELILVEIAYRRLHGETPQAPDYLKRFPTLDPEWLTQALAAPEPAGSPRTLGKFQLLDQVGAGAFGAVWRARDPELDRIVALKIPHAGLLAAPAQRERFHREARAAAQLRHPGIVAVYEVTTLDGLPVIVADFIDGLSLRDLLRERRLGYREAALLVQEVAEAVDYAHGMGVIHRDLKPANILLESERNVERNVGWAESSRPTEPTNAASDAASGGPRRLGPPYDYGPPRIVDFGLALREEAEASLTQEGQIVGTPAYMSPEQAAGHGHQVDRRSDVYSLGVILYELLCRELPFAGPKERIVQQVLHEEPRPPRRVDAKVPRDLETICLKALAKEPARRYPTARALADDLRHWLDGEPIQARPIGALERLWRWGRRKPLIASLTATVVLLFACGFAGVTWQWRRAEREAARAVESRQKGQNLVSAFLSQAQRELARRTGTTPALEELARDALSFLEYMRAEEANDPALLQQLAKAYLQRGDVLGHPDGANLGSTAKARESYDKSFQLYQALVKATPADTEAVHGLMLCHLRLGVIEAERGNTVGALKYFDQALEQAQALVQSYPDDIDYQLDLALCLEWIGDMHVRLDDKGKALALYRESQERRAKLASTPAHRERLLRDCANGYIRLGDLQRKLPEKWASLESYDTALALYTELVRDNPHDARMLRGLALSHQVRADAPAELAIPGFLHHHLEHLRLRRELTQADPRNAQAKRDLAITLSREGDYLRGYLQRQREALARYSDALQLVEELVQSDPDNVRDRSFLAFSHFAVGLTHAELGEMMEALAHYRRLLEMRQELAQRDPRNREAQYLLAEAHQYLGDVFFALHPLRDLWQSKAPLAGLMAGFPGPLPLLVYVAQESGDPAQEALAHYTKGFDLYRD